MKPNFKIEKYFEKINKANECLKCPSLYTRIELEESIKEARFALSEIRDHFEKELNDILSTNKLRENLL